jgi:DNA-binding NtrC family response regulator
MLPGAPPFAEAENVIKTRTLASRLAGSDLPLLIDGEVGTGRRTLAAAVADVRSQGGRELFTFSAFDGVPDELRGRSGAPSVVVLHHVHALDRRSQSEVADLVREGRVILVATGKSQEQPLGPELAGLLEATRVTLPPLRERNADVVAWAELFLARAANELGCPVPTLSSDARRAVGAHPWPGNLSELESVIRRAVVLVRAEVIEAADLGFGEKLVVKALNDAVEEFRMAYVTKVLAHLDGNRTQAARALGIDPRTMFRYLAKAKDEPA